MNKKKNVFRRNSGFIVGCLLAAGASYFTADAVMTKDLASMLMHEEETETLTPETDTVETLAPEESDSRTFETDPFTVTASGNVIKGVESEAPQQKQTESEKESETEESAEGQESDGADEASGQDSYGDEGYYDDGSSDGGSSSDGGYYDDGSSDSGYYDDGSGYYGDGSSDGSYGDGSYDSSIEIQDPGNGDYSYDNVIVTGDGSASTPSDVIIEGISSRYIGEEELYNYDLGQLRLIRNEIFALHGRIFSSQDLADYFSQKSWYVPTYSPEEFDANMFSYLNDYEEANLNVIMNYEAALGGY